MSETTEDIHIQRGGMVRISDDGGCVTLAIHGGMAVPVLHLSADEAGYVASNLMTLSERVIAGTQGRVQELEAAIRRHRDYRGDDRCFQGDGELYSVLPEGDTRPALETAVTLENCRKYIECRQAGREYVSPQVRIEGLEAQLRELLARIDEVVMEAEATSETVPCFLRCSVNAAREAAEQVREGT